MLHYYTYVSHLTVNLKDFQDFQMSYYLLSIFCKMDLFWRKWYLLIFQWTYTTNYLQGKRN